MVMLKSTQSFIKKENTKSVNQPKIITFQPKTFENPNVVGIKSFIIEHPKTSHKLSKTISHAEKVCPNGSLYIDKKTENFLNKKKVKVAKGEHAFKGFASTYNIKILNSFNSEFNLKMLNLELNVS